MKKLIITSLFITGLLLEAGACAIFAYRTPTGMLIGRNFDWLQTGGTVEFVPENRVYGINTQRCILLQQMGNDRPYEGINSSGVFIAMAAIATSPISSTVNSEKPVIDDLGIMRFVLERATNAHEAVKLMNSFKIDYLERYKYPKVHYLIADTEGNVAVFEEGKECEVKQLKIGESASITNVPYNSGESCPRLEKLRTTNNITATAEGIMDILSGVKQNHTVWTSVYNLSDKSILLAIENNRDKPIKINFDDYKLYHKSVDFGELKMRYLNPFGS